MFCCLSPHSFEFYSELLSSFPKVRHPLCNLVLEAFTNCLADGKKKTLKCILLNITGISYLKLKGFRDKISQLLIWSDTLMRWRKVKFVVVVCTMPWFKEQ